MYEQAKSTFFVVVPTLDGMCRIALQKCTPSRVFSHEASVFSKTCMDIASIQISLHGSGVCGKKVTGR